MGVEIRMISRSQFIQGFVDRGEKFEFYFTCNQKPLKGSFLLFKAFLSSKIFLASQAQGLSSTSFFASLEVKEGVKEPYSSVLKTLGLGRKPTFYFFDLMAPTFTLISLHSIYFLMYLRVARRGYQ